MTHRGGGGGCAGGGRTTPGKKRGSQLVCGAGQGTAEIILGMGMPARKAGTAACQDGRHAPGGSTLAEQLLGDPFVGNAPVRLGEALGNAQPLQPILVDASRMRRGQARVRKGAGIRDGKQGVGRRWARRRAALALLGGLQQSGGLGGQARLGVAELHPGSIAAGAAPLWFLIGEARQAAQVTPVGAGRVTAVEPGQLFADPTGERRFERRDTEVHPGLQVPGAGLEYYTGRVSIAAHGGDHGGTGPIQIYEDVSGIGLWRIGLNEYVAALAIAQAEKADCGGMGQLGSGPQPFSGKRPVGLGMNQADEVKVVRHGRELAADGRQGDVESMIVHGPILELGQLAVQWFFSGRRTVG